MEREVGQIEANNRRLTDMLNSQLTNKAAQYEQDLQAKMATIMSKPNTPSYRSSILSPVSSHPPERMPFTQAVDEN